MSFIVCCLATVSRPLPEYILPLCQNKSSRETIHNGNRPFLNYLKPLYQSEAWCSSLHMKMSLICKWMKSHFHMKGWAPRLALKKRLKVIRNWPIVWNAIWSEIILMISKSIEHAAWVWFKIISMISDQNCMTRTSITTRTSIATLLDPFWNRTI